MRKNTKSQNSRSYCSDIQSYIQYYKRLKLQIVKCVYLYNLCVFLDTYIIIDKNSGIVCCCCID